MESMGIAHAAKAKSPVPRPDELLHGTGAEGQNG